MIDNFQESFQENFLFPPSSSPLLLFLNVRISILLLLIHDRPSWYKNTMDYFLLHTYYCILIIVYLLLLIPLSDYRRIILFQVNIARCLYTFKGFITRTGYQHPHINHNACEPTNQMPVTKRRSVVSLPAICRHTIISKSIYGVKLQKNSKFVYF